MRREEGGYGMITEVELTFSNRDIFSCWEITELSSDPLYFYLFKLTVQKFRKRDKEFKYIKYEINKENCTIKVKGLKSLVDSLCKEVNHPKFLSGI